MIKPTKYQQQSAGFQCKSSEARVPTETNPITYEVDTFCYVASHPALIGYEKTGSHNIKIT